MVTYFRWSVPPTVAVVDDQGKDGWESAIGIEFIPNEPLQHTDRIVEHAQRHAGVHRRLELQEHQQIEPSPLDGLHLPQQVDVPLPEVLRDEAGWKPLQSSEVEMMREVADEAAQEICRRARVREDALVGSVVLRLPWMSSLLGHRVAFRGPRNDGLKWCQEGGPSVVSG